MPQHSQPVASQDWTPMVLNSKQNDPVKKTTNTIPSLTNKERKLNDSTEAEKTELLPRNISVQLVAARVAHVPKISQKDLANQLNIPIKYIGVGESIDDLQLFNKKQFVESLFIEK